MDAGAHIGLPSVFFDGVFACWKVPRAKAYRQWVADILSDFKASRIDVLKIEIEGSEFEVLNHSAPWIDSVQTLIIELHDRFRPGCTEALEAAIGGYNFQKSISGESIVITDLIRNAS